PVGSDLSPELGAGSFERPPVYMRPGSPMRFVHARDVDQSWGVYHHRFLSSWESDQWWKRRHWSSRHYWAWRWPAGRDGSSRPNWDSRSDRRWDSGVDRCSGNSRTDRNSGGYR